MNSEKVQDFIVCTSASNNHFPTVDVYVTNCGAGFTASLPHSIEPNSAMCN